MNSRSGCNQNVSNVVQKWLCACALALVLNASSFGQTLPSPVAPEAAASDARQLAVLVGGIVSYTRWPQPPNPIRICILGRDDIVETLRTGTAASSSRPITVHGIKAGVDFKSQCDVVYVTAIPPENARLLLLKTVMAPIVTIGEGQEFCSDGGMFCVTQGAGATAKDVKLKFSVNLDVVSRSGLQINPRVLLLAKPAGVIAQ